MNAIERVQTLSKRLRVIFTVVLVLIPVIQILFWVFFNQLPKDMIPNDLPVAVQQNLPLSARLTALAASFITSGVAMACVYFLIRLFSLYEKAEIFTEGSVKCLRSLGRLILWLFAAGIVQQPLMSMALTLHNPPGQRIIRLGLSSDDIKILLIGIVVVLIAWVMDEGRVLYEEQQLTV
ncbi:MAG TPA: DUF2975 domain-containing protein [Desulfomonilia bacterium]